MVIGDMPDNEVEQALARAGVAPAASVRYVVETLVEKAVVSWTAGVWRLAVPPGRSW